jgi:hypothetical protein
MKSSPELENAPDIISKLGNARALARKVPSRIKSALASAPKPRVPLERETQAAIVDYCRAVLPAGSLVFAIPNGSRRTSTGKASNAVPGLLKGVCDLQILTPCGLVLFAEIKREKGGTVSAEQFNFMQSVRFLRHHAAVWREIEDARNTFAALKIATRESPAPATGEAA